MAEWSKALVLKTSVRVSVPWVRIPVHPLLFTRRALMPLVLPDFQECRRQSTRLTHRVHEF